MKAVGLAFAESWRAAPLASAMTLLEVIARVMTVIPPVLVGVMVTCVTVGDVWGACAAGGAVVLCIGVSEGLSTIGIHARVQLRERVGFAFDQRIAAMLAQLPTLEHRHRSDVAEKIRLLTEETGALGNAVNRMLNVVLNLIYVVGSVAVALSASWWMLIPVAASCATFLFTSATARAQADGETKSAAGALARERLLDTGTTWTALWDARVHGGLAILRQRYDEAVERWTSPRRTAERRVAALTGADQVVFLLSSGIALLLVAQDAAAGRTSPGALAQAFVLVTTLASLSAVGVFTLTLAGKSLRSMNRFLWLEGFVRQEMTRRSPCAPTSPDHIELRAASYVYPGAQTPALHPTTLRIPAGAFVVVVGDNGSGKTTLASLILGVIQPTTGAVSVFGLPATDHLVSAITQQFVRYRLRMRDSIGFGHVESLDDDAALRNAADEGHATALVEAHGWEAPLGEQWTNGVSLSGGQWQRLATARGLLSPQDAIVLDEPAAALDAIAERRLTDRLRERARGDRRQTHLLVTHRLDSAMDADLIVVLDRGRVVETGPPLDLVARNGRFAQLMALHDRLSSGKNI